MESNAKGHGVEMIVYSERQWDLNESSLFILEGGGSEKNGHSFSFAYNLDSFLRSLNPRLCKPQTDRHQGWKSRKDSAFPTEKYRINLPVYHYFCLSPTMPDIKTSENRQNFSLSFGKVPKIFTCPPLFLPILDRRTVSNSHPCSDIY